jgi:phasin family protein
MRTHLDAQIAFMHDLSKSLFNSFQQMCDLNIQLAQAVLEESTLASQHAMSQQRPAEALNAASAHAQPAVEKLRAYQQHMSRLAVDAQADLARVTEQHVQQTSRTARALADEVQRAASEETERGIRTQQETLRKFSDPFQAVAGARNFVSAAAATMQSAVQGASQMGSESGEAQEESAASMQKTAA